MYALFSIVTCFLILIIHGSNDQVKWLDALFDKISRQEINLNLTNKSTNTSLKYEIAKIEPEKMEYMIAHTLNPRITTQYKAGHNINSITKSLTVMLLMLQDYDVNKPIQEYYKNDFVVHKDFEDKTIRDFMNHETGIEDELLLQACYKKLRHVTMLDYAKHSQISHKQKRTLISKFILTNPLKQNIKQFHQYSNFGYLILGNVIEKNFKLTLNKHPYHKHLKDFSFEEIMKFLFQTYFNVELGFASTNPEQISSRYNGLGLLTSSYIHGSTKHIWVAYRESKTQNMLKKYKSLFEIMSPAMGVLLNEQNLQKYISAQGRAILFSRVNEELENLSNRFQKELIL